MLVSYKFLLLLLFLRSFQLGEIPERDRCSRCSHFLLQTGKQAKLIVWIFLFNALLCCYHAAALQLTLSSIYNLSSPSRASRLQLMSSRQGWSWRPRTHGTPHPPASPRWWAWQAHACGCAWTGPTTRTTSGAWWTPRRSSQLETARRTEACCSHLLVRAHTNYTMASFILQVFNRLCRVFPFFHFCPLGVSGWQHRISLYHDNAYK